MDLLNLLHFYYERQLLSYLSICLYVCLSISSVHFIYIQLRQANINAKQPTNHQLVLLELRLLFFCFCFCFCFFEHFLDSLFLFFYLFFFVPFYTNYNEVVSSSQPASTVDSTFVWYFLSMPPAPPHNISTKILASL